MQIRSRPGKLPASTSKEQEKQSLGQFLKELPVLLVVALAIAVVVKAFVIQAFFIPSGSMENTLLVNDRVLVSKFIYRFTQPRRPDVVVFVSPISERLPQPQRGPVATVMNEVAQGLGLRSSEQDFIKRVVATQGETVQVKDGILLVNGRAVPEPYLKDSEPMPNYGPTTVPKDRVFVMGDNRSNSEDSRVFGPIPRSSIVGKAFVLIWPISRIRWLGGS